MYYYCVHVLLSDKLCTELSSQVFYSLSTVILLENSQGKVARLRLYSICALIRPMDIPTIQYRCLYDAV